MAPWRRKLGFVFMIAGAVFTVFYTSGGQTPAAEPGSFEHVAAPTPVPVRLGAPNTVPEVGNAPTPAMPDLKFMSNDEFEELLDFDNTTVVFNNFNRTFGIQRPPAGVCDGQEMVVYIMTMSDEKSYRQRQAIRDMFERNKANRNVILRFFHGRLEGARFDLIVPEMRKYGDLVYYDADEFYRDNFLKWHAMHVWHTRYCGGVKWFLKLDDDTAVFYPRFFHWLDKDFDGRTANLTDYFVCTLMRGFRPVRSPKNKRWYISRFEYPQNKWPNYCYGYFVLYSNSTVAKVLEYQQQVKLLHMDDVLYTGVVAKAANISVVHFPGVLPEFNQNRKCGSDGTPLRIARHNSKSPSQMKTDVARIKHAVCF